MPKFDPSKPDAYFQSANLVAEWDNLPLAKVTDLPFRELLIQIREQAMNLLADPAPVPGSATDDGRFLISRYLDGLLSMVTRKVEKMGLIQPHWQEVYHDTIVLAIATKYADTTLDKRMAAEADMAKWGVRKGLSIEVDLDRWAENE